MSPVGDQGHAVILVDGVPPPRVGVHGVPVHVFVGGQQETKIVRVVLLPITRGTERWHAVPTCEKDLKRLEPDRAALEAWSEGHREEVQSLLRNYHEKLQHERQWAKIAPDDGV